MENKGLVIGEPGATIETHMAGRQPLLPTGFSIYQVFYVLRGGLSAQEAFFRRRSPKIKAKYGLQISSLGLHDSPSITMLSDKYVELRPSDRTWLFNPFTKLTLEYVSASHSNISATGDHDDVSDSLGPESEEDLHPITLDTDNTSTAPSETDTSNLPAHVPVVLWLGGCTKIPARLISVRAPLISTQPSNFDDLMSITRSFCIQTKALHS